MLLLRRSLRPLLRRHAPPRRHFSLQGNAAASLLSSRLASLEGDMPGVQLSVSERKADDGETAPASTRIALLLHADRSPQRIEEGGETRTHFGPSLIAAALPPERVGEGESEGLGTGDLGLLRLREKHGVRLLSGSSSSSPSPSPASSALPPSSSSSPLIQLPLRHAADLPPSLSLSFAAQLLTDVEIRRDTRLTARYTLQAALAGIVTEMWDLFREGEGVWFSAEVRLGEGGELDVLAPHLEFDDYALHRAPPSLQALAAAQSASVDSNTAQATSGGLFYVKLPVPGRVGVGSFGYGAGNAMGTMDALASAGGHPANFLDGGGGANRANARLGIETLGRDPDVKAVLVNTFGGLTQTDVVALGIVDAVKEGGVQVPIVVRILGTGSDKAKETLRGAGLGNVTLEDDFKTAARLAVEKSHGG